MTIFGELSMIDHVTSMDRLQFYWDLHPTALDDVICSGGRMALSKQLQGGPTRDGKLTWSPAGPWGTCFFHKHQIESYRRPGAKGSKPFISEWFGV